MTSHNCAAGPQIDERVDVAIERIPFRKNVQHAMEHHVRLERAHEEECEGARIAAADDAGVHRPAKVVGHDHQSAAGRAVSRIRIERHHDRARLLVHIHGNVLADDFLDEGNELLGDTAQDPARIAPGIDVFQLDDERWRTRQPAAHRGAEKLLLRSGMTQHRGRRDVQLARDVGERRRVEALRREDASRGLQQLFPGNPRWPAHL